MKAMGPFCSFEGALIINESAKKMDKKISFFKNCQTLSNLPLLIRFLTYQSASCLSLLWTALRASIICLRSTCGWVLLMTVPMAFKSMNIIPANVNGVEGLDSSPDKDTLLGLLVSWILSEDSI